MISIRSVMFGTVAVICGLCVLVDDVTAQSCNITTQREVALKKYDPPAKMISQTQEFQTADSCFEACCNYTNSNGDTCTSALFYSLGILKKLCYLVSCLPPENCKLTPAKGVDVIMAEMNREIPTTVGPDMTTIASQNDNSTVSGNTGMAEFAKTFITIFVAIVAVVVGVSLIVVLVYMGCRKQGFGKGPEQTKLKEDFSKAAYKGEENREQTKVNVDGEK